MVRPSRLAVIRSRVRSDRMKRYSSARESGIGRSIVRARARVLRRPVATDVCTSGRASPPGDSVTASGVADTSTVDRTNGASKAGLAAERASIART